MTSVVCGQRPSTAGAEVQKHLRDGTSSGGSISNDCIMGGLPMPGRSPYLDHRHLRFYGSVLGARPESFDLDDDHLVVRVPKSKNKKSRRKKFRRDIETREGYAHDFCGQRAG